MHRDEGARDDDGFEDAEGGRRHEEPRVLRDGEAGRDGGAEDPGHRDTSSCQRKTHQHRRRELEHLFFSRESQVLDERGVPGRGRREEPDHRGEERNGREHASDDEPEDDAEPLSFAARAREHDGEEQKRQDDERRAEEPPGDEVLLCLGQIVHAVAVTLA